MDAGLKACWDEDWAKAQSVVKMGSAKLDEIDSDGWCMMHHAVWGGRKDLLEALLAAGASPRVKDKEGLTPGTLACAKERWELAQCVASQGRKLDEQDVDGWAMLHYAAAHGQESLTSMLLARGADASLSDRERLTPALAACAKDEWKTALLLSNHGASLGAQDEDGWSLAHYAVDKGQKELLSSLIQRGAPLDKLNADGMSPGALALSDPNNHWAVAELIDAGVQVDSKSLAQADLGVNGRTAEEPARAPRHFRG